MSSARSGYRQQEKRHAGGSGETQARFWRPPQQLQSSHVRAADGSDETETLVAQSSVRVAPQRLPIHEVRKDVLSALEHRRVVIVCGDTGTGKSTQLPQMMLKANWAAPPRRIAVVQPQAFAATSLASRVSAEVGCAKVGDDVGYLIPFGRQIHAQHTRLVYASALAMVRTCFRDPLLSQYSVVMVDECHTGELWSDVLLGILLLVLRRRADLRVILSSATMDVKKQSDFFGEFEPRVFAVRHSLPKVKVEVQYLKECARDYIRSAASATISVLQARVRGRSSGYGSVLVFLATRDDVLRCAQLLKDAAAASDSAWARDVRFLPLYAGQPPREQARVFDERGRSLKIVLSTKVAETAVTIPNVGVVIDTLLESTKFVDPNSGIINERVLPVSKSAAAQRKARAGRTHSSQKALCLRLTTLETFEQLADHSKSELCRRDLSSAVLALLFLGVRNVHKFPFVSRPSAALLRHALERLYAVRAIDAEGQLQWPCLREKSKTETGTGTAAAAALLSSRHGAAAINDLCLTDIRLARTVNAAIFEHSCGRDGISLAAMLLVADALWTLPAEVHPTDEEGIDKARRHIYVKEGDHPTLLNVWRQWSAQRRTSRSEAAEWCRMVGVSNAAMLRAAAIRAQLARAYKLAYGGVAEGTDTVDAMLETSCEQDVNALLKALAAGFCDSVAVRGGGGRGSPDEAGVLSGMYQSMRGQSQLRPSEHSVLSHRLLAAAPPVSVVFHEAVSLRRNATAEEKRRDWTGARLVEVREMREVTSIPAWLLAEAAPHAFSFDVGVAHRSDIKRQKTAPSGRGAALARPRNRLVTDAAGRAVIHRDIF